MKVALYARVSTEEQAQHGLSIETQLDNLRSWAKANGHSVIDEYVDAGVSARKSPAKRPELQRLLGDLDRIELVAFTKLDRWTRNVKGYYDVQEKLDAAHVAWTAIQEDYETVTATGRFKVNILLAVSENEADRTSERIKVVFDRKIAQGEHVGQTPPIGYSVVNKHLMPNDDADVARGTFQTFLLTGSIRQALDYLHAHGFPLIYSSIRNMLSNETYIGRFHGNPNYCEPIITQEDFYRVQEMLQERSVRKNPTRREYIFSGLIRCACCDHVMAGVYNGRLSAHNRFRYRCDRHFLNHLCDNKKFLSEVELEDQLLTRLEEDLPAFSVSTKAPRVKKPKDNSKKLERLNELYIEGVITKEQFNEKRSQLIDPPEAPKPDLALARKIALSDNVRESYQLLSRQEKRMLWRSIVESIVADGENVTVAFRLG